MSDSMDHCLFCNIGSGSRVLENQSFYAIYDKFPVNPGHLLIILKRHALDYFSLNELESQHLYRIVAEAKCMLDAQQKPDGYNIGMNCGRAAGQTIFHFHMHIIPRYKDDVKEPKGGVRNLKEPIVPYDDVSLL